MRSVSVSGAQATLVLSLLLGSLSVEATPTFGNTFHFRDQRSANTVGFFIGDRLTFGSGSVVPSGAGTTVTGTNPGFAGVNALHFFPTVNAPNQYSNSVAYDPVIAANAWTLIADDGNGPTAIATTPIPGTVAATPFIQSFSMANPGVTPNFQWSVPSGSTHNGQSIIIFDLELEISGLGQPPIIFADTIDNADRSYTVPLNVLEGEGHRYSVAIQLDDFAGPLLSRSRSFFDFVTSDLVFPAGAAGPVFLPSVDPTGNPTGNPTGGPVYEFNVAETTAGETIFIDPFVAVGYEYQKGDRDANFASVVLPLIGDGIFTIAFADGGSSIVQSIVADIPFVFPTGGVASFTVTGIETDALLNPNDPTAFVTGLTFVADTPFTGTMTPISQFVPAPGTLLLMATLVPVVGYSARRRRRRTALSNARPGWHP